MASSQCCLRRSVPVRENGCIRESLQLWYKSKYWNFHGVYMHRNVFETTLQTGVDFLVLAEFELFGFLQVRFVTDQKDWREITIWTAVSSAYCWRCTPEEITMWPTGYVNIEKRSGPSTEPWGTPIVKCFRTVRVPQQHVAPDPSNMSWSSQ